MTGTECQKPGSGRVKIDVNGDSKCTYREFAEKGQERVGVVSRRGSCIKDDLGS